MNLIIDTSSENLKVILCNEKMVLENEQTGDKHLKHLLPEIEKLLLKATKKITDVDVFGVVLGPGSFTGVRIGVSTIKAFACALENKFFLGINMFELLSFTIIKNNNIKTNFYIAIKSTSSKYYYALCNSKGEILEMNLIPLTELTSIIEEQKVSIFSYNTTLKFNDFNSENIILTTQDYVNFINLKISKKSFTTLQDLKPIYLALSQAEEEYYKKREVNGDKNS